MSSVKQEDVQFGPVEVRPMHELDVPVIVAIERAAYQFPWSEGIFRDCLRVGYVCRVVDVGGDMAGYGIMSVGAGEAHILNVCIRDEYRGRGYARKILVYLLDRARASGMYEAFLEVRPSNTAAARLYHSMQGRYPYNDRLPGADQQAACIVFRVRSRAPEDFKSC